MTITTKQRLEKSKLKRAVNFLIQIIKQIVCDIDRNAMKSENKRPIEIADDENEIEERKKLKTEDGAEQITESILDDIHLDDIESRITVHVIETPEACTHEVAVYPGKHFRLDNT